MDRDGLIHNWASDGNASLPAPSAPILLDDETLRDGLQCPSVVDPSLGEKIRLVHLMDRLGINTADIGLPGAGSAACDHILALAREMQSMSITPNVACRTLVRDIEPVVEMVQALGTPIEVCAFIGVHCHFANVTLKMIRANTNCYTMALCQYDGHEDALLSIRDLDSAKLEKIIATIKDVKKSGKVTPWAFTPEGKEELEEIAARKAKNKAPAKEDTNLFMNDLEQGLDENAE